MILYLFPRELLKKNTYVYTYLTCEQVNKWDLNQVSNTFLVFDSFDLFKSIFHTKCEWAL